MDWRREIEGMSPQDAIDTLLEALRQHRPESRDDPIAMTFRLRFGSSLTQGAIAAALYTSRGVTVSRDRLCQVSSASEGTVRTAVCGLRKALDGTSYAITTDHRVGYVMTGPDLE